MLNQIVMLFSLEKLVCTVFFGKNPLPASWYPTLQRQRQSPVRQEDYPQLHIKYANRWILPKGKIVSGRHIGGVVIFVDYKNANFPNE